MLERNTGKPPPNAAQETNWEFARRLAPDSKLYIEAASHRATPAGGGKPERRRAGHFTSQGKINRVAEIAEAPRPLRRRAPSRYTKPSEEQISRASPMKKRNWSGHRPIDGRSCSDASTGMGGYGSQRPFCNHDLSTLWVNAEVPEKNLDR